MSSSYKSSLSDSNNSNNSNNLSNLDKAIQKLHNLDGDDATAYQDLPPCHMHELWLEIRNKAGLGLGEFSALKTSIFHRDNGNANNNNNNNNSINNNNSNNYNNYNNASNINNTGATIIKQEKPHIAIDFKEFEEFEEYEIETPDTKINKSNNQNIVVINMVTPGSPIPDEVDVEVPIEVEVAMNIEVDAVEVEVVIENVENVVTSYANPNPIPNPVHVPIEAGVIDSIPPALVAYIKNNYIYIDNNNNNSNGNNNNSNNSDNNNVIIDQDAIYDYIKKTSSIWPLLKAHSWKYNNRNEPYYYYTDGKKYNSLDLTYHIMNSLRIHYFPNLKQYNKPIDKASNKGRSNLSDELISKNPKKTKFDLIPYKKSNKKQKNNNNNNNPILIDYISPNKPLPYADILLDQLDRSGLPYCLYNDINDILYRIDIGDSISSSSSSSSSSS